MGRVRKASVRKWNGSSVVRQGHFGLGHQRLRLRNFVPLEPSQRAVPDRRPILAAWRVCRDRSPAAQPSQYLSVEPVQSLLAQSIKSAISGRADLRILGPLLRSQPIERAYFVALLLLEAVFENKNFAKKMSNPETIIASLSICLYICTEAHFWIQRLHFNNKMQ